jgi:hypothetical protein
MRARVFISCGQDQRSDEVGVVNSIAAQLWDLGYDPYIAVQEHTLRGVTDNVFRRLAESEYLVFIDFKREKLLGTEDHRGSLFTHQELAVETYLDLDVLAFQEEGVRKLDGIIQFLQTNAISFSDRALVPKLVADKVVSSSTPNWRNELSLKRDPKQLLDVPAVGRAGHPAGNRRFFYASVRNHHKSFAAAHAYVYLDSIASPGEDGLFPLKPLRSSGQVTCSPMP